MRRVRFRMAMVSLAAALSMGGCGVLQIAYDRAEWLILRRIDSYFDLESAQKDRLEPVLARHTKWFKADRFDPGLDLLVTGEKLLDDGITPHEFDQLDRMTKDWWKAIYLRVAPDAAHFVRGLNRQQLERAREKMAEGDETLVDLLAEDPEDWDEEYEDYFERVYDYYEDFVGDLTPRQKQMIWRERRRTRAQMQQRLDMRRHLRRAMFRAIRSSTSDADLLAKFNAWAKDPDAAGSQHYREYRAREDQRWRAFILAFDQTLSAEQRKHAGGKLHKWIERLQSIDR